MATHVSRILKTEAVLIWSIRSASSQTAKNVKHFPMVVLGGGTGGTSVAARACRMLGNGNVAVVDPSEVLIFTYLILGHQCFLLSMVYHSGQKSADDVKKKKKNVPRYYLLVAQNNLNGSRLAVKL